MSKDESILPHLSTMTRAILDNLTPREREVLETRFGINGRTKPAKVEEIENKFAARLEKITETQKKKVDDLMRWDRPPLPEGAVFSIETHICSICRSKFEFFGQAERCYRVCVDRKEKGEEEGS